MAYRLTCPCGETLYGRDQDQLVVSAQQHLTERHDRSYTAELPAPASEIAVALGQGDWLSFSELERTHVRSGFQVGREYFESHLASSVDIHPRCLQVDHELLLKGTRMLATGFAQ